jgi:hypothetical protein
MFHATGLSGRQRFGGYGYAAPFAAQPDPAAEKRVLQAHADALQAEMNAIKKRLSDIDIADTAD